MPTSWPRCKTSSLMMRLRWGEVVMKKGLTLTLEDAELIELCRVLIDKDAEGALEFLQAHLKGKARDLLEGG